MFMAQLSYSFEGPNDTHHEGRYIFELDRKKNADRTFILGRRGLEWRALIFKQAFLNRGSDWGQIF